MRFTLHIWRQENSDSKGFIETHEIEGISEEMSFLEMLDLLNENLIKQGRDAVTFDSDCRGESAVPARWRSTADRMVPARAAPVSFARSSRMATRSGSSRSITPRSRSSRTSWSIALHGSNHPVGRLHQCHSGPSRPNSIPVSHVVAEEAMDASACIGCSCVAACPNGRRAIHVSEGLISACSHEGAASVLE